MLGVLQIRVYANRMLGGTEVWGSVVAPLDEPAEAPSAVWSNGGA